MNDLNTITSCQGELIVLPSRVSLPSEITKKYSLEQTTINPIVQYYRTRLNISVISAKKKKRIQIE